MSLFLLKTRQVLPITLEEAWKFFSSPENLNKITPPYLSFKITSGINDELENPYLEMYPGMIISYTVKPVLNIPVKWVTEITQVSKPNFFIDEQRFGPYKFWHHKHFFRKVENGVEMLDVIHYKIKFGIFGILANQLFVQKQLAGIFSYRYQKLTEIFGTAE